MTFAILVFVTGCAERAKDETPEPRAVRPAPRPRARPQASGPQDVVVYFAKGDSCAVQAVPRTVPAGTPIEVLRGTLEALIAGPTAEEAAAGFSSAIPDTLEILRHRMRHVTAQRDSPHEGRRVEIQFIEPLPDGLVRVSFSKEMNAYDHGATRVCTLVRQIQETVKQFEEWKGVSIAIDRETEGVLQP